MAHSSMKKPSKRQPFSRTPRAAVQEPESFERAAPVQKRDATPIKPMNEGQKRYLAAMKTFQLVFATGPAGTGKTWMCASYAAEQLHAGVIDKIIITRPAVEAGESLGFLPGELDEKYEPYLRPLIETFNERLGKGATQYFVKSGRIEALPLAYMRGMTFKDCIVILDEAQNVSPLQMKMFLTRIGNNCKVFVNGDIDQKDIAGYSGLEDAVQRLSFIPSVKHIRFSKGDIVRSGLCQEIVESYSTSSEPL
jgi:phosphate starvation-inducible PhoH-like protein